MGRINLAALRVRRRALANFNSKIGASKGSSRTVLPNWVDIVGEIPPAQVLTRQQPHQHPISAVRTRSLPGSSQTQQYATISAPPRPQRKSGKGSSRLFAPVEIRYEEDELRRQFFSDHPWELARPRIVLETTGQQYASADWSQGLIQKGIPLSGESVIQRQLWLLNNTPDITVPQAYDIARREFYMLRRAEETRRRIALEEAQHMGARFEKTAMQWGMEIENEMYNDWESWSKDQIMEQLAKNSAFGGETMDVEQDALSATDEVENPRMEANGPSRSGNGKPMSPFQAEAQRRAQYNTAPTS